MASWLVEAAHRLLVGLVPEEQGEQQEQQEHEEQEQQVHEEQEEREVHEVQQEQQRQQTQQEREQDRGKVLSARSARVEPYLSQIIISLKM